MLSKKSEKDLSRTLAINEKVVEFDFVDCFEASIPTYLMHKAVRRVYIHKTALVLSRQTININFNFGMNYYLIA